MKSSQSRNDQKVNALADSADDDVARRLHENHFKERQTEASGIIARTGEEESLASKKSPRATAQQKVVECGSTAEIYRSRIDGDRAELERIADGVVSEEGKNVRREVQHHQMTGILLPHQAAGQQSESGLHEQHQIPSE